MLFEVTFAEEKSCLFGLGEGRRRKESKKEKKGAKIPDTEPFIQLCVDRKTPRRRKKARRQQPREKKTVHNKKVKSRKNYSFWPGK